MWPWRGLCGEAHYILALEGEQVQDDSVSEGHVQIGIYQCMPHVLLSGLLPQTLDSRNSFFPPCSGVLASARRGDKST